MLSPEDKARIDEEEAYRLEARRRIEAELERKHAAAAGEVYQEERDPYDTSSERTVMRPLSPATAPKSSNNGCLIAILCVMALIGVVYPPFFVGAVLVAVFWAAIKFLKS